MTVALEPPVAYQGGKTRIADEIVRLLGRETIWPGSRFYDLCCGCGAVSIALVRSGVAPRRIVMVDTGPWGEFWLRVGAGTLDLDALRTVIEDLPEERGLIQDAVRLLAEAPVEPALAPYVFLVLQAASFGGKPVGLESGRWRTHGFRSLWQPTATSNRRSPVNPMMPMPETLLARVEELAVRMRGVSGVQKDAIVVADTIPNGSLVYIDPPYAGTTGYGRGFDVAELARAIARRGSTCLVSEGKALGPEAVLVASARKKGGISGNRAKANEEWVTVFRPHQSG